MTDLKEIKDRAPNEATIRELENLLAAAKAGELRTIVCLMGFDDDSWGHFWSIDSRNTRRRMIGELTMLHHDMLVNQSLHDGDSVLCHALE